MAENYPAQPTAFAPREPVMAENDPAQPTAFAPREPVAWVALTAALTAAKLGVAGKRFIYGHSAALARQKRVVDSSTGLAFAALQAGSTLLGLRNVAPDAGAFTQYGALMLADTVELIAFQESGWRAVLFYTHHLFNGGAWWCGQLSPTTSSGLPAVFMTGFLGNLLYYAADLRRARGGRKCPQLEWVAASWYAMWLLPMWLCIVRYYPHHSRILRACSIGAGSWRTAVAAYMVYVVALRTRLSTRHA